MLSLFQCSTTKLKSEEAAQIESIIQTLSVLKPDLNASYIFTADMGLIASVSFWKFSNFVVSLVVLDLWNCFNACFSGFAVSSLIVKRLMIYV